MNKEKLKQLWARINDKVKAGELRPLSGVDSEEKFLRLMSTPSNRKKFWEATHTEYYKAGINLGELEDFEAIYGGSALSKYVGTYDGEGTLFPSFEIIEKEGKLYMKKGGLEVVLEKISENKFKGKFLEEFEITFTVTGDSAKGGNIVVSNKTINFTKSLLGSSLSTLNWIEVANSTWDALKRAGYWVKEEGGKLLAAIKDGLHVKENEINVWDCIENYLQGQGFFKLMSGSDGKNFYRFTATDFVHNKKYTNLFFYADGRVEYKYRDSGKTVPNYTGKWSCGDNENSFEIKWDNGEVDTYGRFFQAGNNSDGRQTQQDGGQGSNISNTTGAPKIQSFSQVCSAVLACPKIDDVKQGKKMYKVCMKCPEIQQFQEMSPLFKQIYFDLLQENGKKQQSDQYFGPIMQAAIRNFQETIDKNKFLNEWGMIGKNTLDYLSKQPDLPQQQPTQQTSQPQTAPKYELTQDKIVTNQTKF